MIFYSKKILFNRLKVRNLKQESIARHKPSLRTPAVTLHLFECPVGVEGKSFINTGTD